MGSVKVAAGPRNHLYRNFIEGRLIVGQCDHFGNLSNEFDTERPLWPRRDNDLLNEVAEDQESLIADFGVAQCFAQVLDLLAIEFG